MRLWDARKNNESIHLPSKVNNPQLNILDSLPIEIVSIIISCTDIKDMNSLSKTNKHMKQIVYQTATKYLINTGHKQKYGTYSEISEVFKIRRSFESKINKTKPSEMSKFLITNNGSIALSFSLSALIGVGLFLSRHFTFGPNISVGKIGAIGVATATVIGDIAIIGTLSRCYSLFQNKVKTKENEAKKLSDEMEAKYPKPIIL